MIVLGCDHGGLAIKNAIAADLKARGVEYKDVGTYTEESVDYPVYAKAVSAEMTRRHNDANVLCLGGRVIDCKKAVELARIFLSTPFEGGRHAKRVAMLEK